MLRVGNCTRSASLSISHDSLQLMLRHCVEHGSFAGVEEYTILKRNNAILSDINSTRTSFQSLLCIKTTTDKMNLTKVRSCWEYPRDSPAPA